MGQAAVTALFKELSRQSDALERCEQTETEEPDSMDYMSTLVQVFDTASRFAFATLAPHMSL